MRRALGEGVWGQLGGWGFITRLSQFRMALGTRTDGNVRSVGGTPEKRHLCFETQNVFRGVRLCFW